MRVSENKENMNLAKQKKKSFLSFNLGVKQKQKENIAIYLMNLNIFIH